jgi:hypothetical protein
MVRLPVIQMSTVSFVRGRLSVMERKRRSRNLDEKETFAESSEKAKLNPGLLLFAFVNLEQQRISYGQIFDNTI